MAKALSPEIWFVRSNRGAGSYPVSPEGWRVVRIFLAGMIVSGVVAGFAALFAPGWIWIAIAALGMIGSAAWFIDKAQRDTDNSTTYTDFLKDKNNA